MKRLWRRLEKLETRSGFDHFALESDGWVFMYQGGDLLVVPAPMTTEAWIAERERENAKLTGPPEDVRVTQEENEAARKAHEDRIIAAGAKVGLGVRFRGASPCGALRVVDSWRRALSELYRGGVRLNHK